MISWRQTQSTEWLQSSLWRGGRRQAVWPSEGDHTCNISKSLLHVMTASKVSCFHAFFCTTITSPEVRAPVPPKTSRAEKARWIKESLKRNNLLLASLFTVSTGSDSSCENQANNLKKGKLQERAHNSIWKGKNYFQDLGKNVKRLEYDTVSQSLHSVSNKGVEGHVAMFQLRTRSPATFYHHHNYIRRQFTSCIW